VKLKDYLPLKAIVEDLGVSRWTLWRAARSDIPDFPKPKKVGRQLYWKKTELDALEAALLRFEGRCVFDRRRKHEKKVKALTKSRVAAGAPRKLETRATQQDLFSS
jgi:predicted DNA-binding transcriptional regulator AlpA